VAVIVLSAKKTPTAGFDDNLFKISRLVVQKHNLVVDSANVRDLRDKNKDVS